MKKEENFQNLYKKIDTTSKTRFNAARRFAMHSRFSTYSIVGISLILILIALMQAYSLGVNIDSDVVSLIQVFSSIAVLVYSLLIEKNDYSNLSEKMYSCASKLGKLKQDIYPYIDNTNLSTFAISESKSKQSYTHNKENKTKFDEFKNNYHDILELYETHSINDFKPDFFRAKLEMTDNFPISKIEHITLRSKIYFLYILNFISYAIVLSVIVILIYWLWCGF